MKKKIERVGFRECAWCVCVCAWCVCVPGVCVCVCLCVLLKRLTHFSYFTTGMNAAGFLLSAHTPLLTKGQSF